MSWVWSCVGVRRVSLMDCDLDFVLVRRRRLCDLRWMRRSGLARAGGSGIWPLYSSGGGCSLVEMASGPTAVRRDGFCFGRVKYLSWLEWTECDEACLWRLCSVVCEAVCGTGWVLTASTVWGIHAFVGLLMRPSTACVIVVLGDERECLIA